MDIDFAIVFDPELRPNGSLVLAELFGFELKAERFRAELLVAGSTQSRPRP